MKIAILLPGTAYTKGFFQSWTKLISYFTQQGIQYSISNHYCPVVYEGRNLMLLNGQRANINAVPLQGVDYDFMLWLETDMVFTPEDVMNLIAADTDIISALYPMGVNAPEAAVAGWLPDKRIHIPSAFKEEPKAIPVDFCGLGFILVKRGVFEKLKYPWFKKMYSEPDEQGNIDYLGDDFSFCEEVKQLGYTVYIHTRVVAGHEKSIILK